MKKCNTVSGIRKLPIAHLVAIDRNVPWILQFLSIVRGTLKDFAKEFFHLHSRL
jgi:hypothetical protein